MIGALDMSLINLPIISVPITANALGNVDYGLQFGRLIYRKSHRVWRGRVRGTDESIEQFPPRMNLDTGATDIFLPMKIIRDFLSFFGCYFVEETIACPCFLMDDEDAGLIFDLGDVNLTLTFSMLSDRQGRGRRSYCYVRVRAGQVLPVLGIPFFHSFMVPGNLRLGRQHIPPPNNVLTSDRVYVVSGLHR
jgi:hypothetical protein